MRAVQQLQGPDPGHAGLPRLLGADTGSCTAGSSELIVNAMADVRPGYHRVGVALMDVRLLGINHHTAPLELRERLALDGAGVAAVLREIRSGVAAAEAVLLATCNRTELYVAAADPAAAESGMRRVFERLAGDRAALVPAHAYAETGERAARHLLRVAAGLDSMILGEHQILGQVREAQSRAQEAETLGPLTHRLWSAALHAGKRARAETDIGMGAVSVAQAAVCLAERAVGDLRGRRVLVIGAGDTCRLAARHVADRRPARLWVANRTVARAAAIAEAFGGDPVALDRLDEVLPSADAVISATRAPGSRPHLRPGAAGHGGTPRPASGARRRRDATRHRPGLRRGDGGVAVLDRRGPHARRPEPGSSRARDPQGGGHPRGGGREVLGVDPRAGRGGRGPRTGRAVRTGARGGSAPQPEALPSRRRGLARSPDPGDDHAPAPPAHHPADVRHAPAGGRVGAARSAARVVRPRSGRDLEQGRPWRCLAPRRPCGSARAAGGEEGLPSVFCLLSSTGY
ncbi:MAG: glutamyl-tRNA reductase [Candidatus Moduliflexus flocculans]|nr:glutamyl-tRNA reductase [Candidatus Moduliflexus flocculans]